MNRTITTLKKEYFSQALLADKLQNSYNVGTIIKIYKAARVSTLILGSDQNRQKSGTLKQYKRIIVNLKKQSSIENSAFKGFELITSSTPPYSKNTISTYKSALKSYASRTVLNVLPSILLKAAHPNYKKAIAEYFSKYAYFEKELKSGLPTWQVEELATAIGFLINNPPLVTPRTSIEKQEKTESYKRRPTQSKFNDLRYFENYLKKSGSSLTFLEYCWEYYELLDIKSKFTRAKQLIAATFLSTGCRPSEFQAGILGIIGFEKETGAKCLAFRINGKKLSSSEDYFKHDRLDVHEAQYQKTVEGIPALNHYLNRGQSYRYIIHRSFSGPQAWLEQFIKQAKISQDKIPQKLSDELDEVGLIPKDIRLLKFNRQGHALSTNPAALNKSFTRDGRKIFQGSAYNLTPYVFRHAFKTAFENQNGLDRMQLSAALGHQSQKSKNHYGRRHSKSSNLQFKNVTAFAPTLIRANYKTYSNNSQITKFQHNYGGNYV